MKKRGFKIALLAVATLVAGYFIWNIVHHKEEIEEVITIGAVLPLTGNSAVWGVPTMEGIVVAQKNYNDKGGYHGKKINVIFEDSKGDPTTGVSAITKLIDINKVQAVIDNSNSAVTLAMAPIANKNEIVLLPTGSSSPEITHAGKYVYRIWNSDALEGEIMADFVMKEYNSNIGIIAVNNSYGIGLSKAFENGVISKGGNIRSFEFFEESATDFKTQIQKIKDNDVTNLYIVCYPKQGAQILNQLIELGYRGNKFGAVAFEDSDLLINASNAAEGLMFPLPSPVDTTSTIYQLFSKEFAETYNKSVPFLAAEGYDGFNVLMEAIERAKNYDGKSIANGLSSIKGYSGVSGMIKFDSNGDVNKPFGLRIVEEGEFRWMKKEL